MTTPAEYRRYAEESLQAMRAALVPEVRAVLLSMAQRWSAAAERAERNADLQAAARQSRPQDFGARPGNNENRRIRH